MTAVSSVVVTMGVMTPGQLAAIPDDYLDLLESLKDRVRQARTTAQRTVNAELIELYWNIGHQILIRQGQEGWGSGVVKRLAEDLRAEFPDMTGFSQRNLQYMRTMVEAWGGASNVPQAVAQLRWATSGQFSIRPNHRKRGIGIPTPRSELAQQVAKDRQVDGFEMAIGR